jgi:putative copper export protein
MLVNIGLMLAFGTLFAYRFVLYPAWSNRAFPAGGLAPRVMQAIYGLATTGTVAAFVGSVIWLFEQASVLFSADLGRVLSESLWLSVLNTTQFGEFWKIRAILIVCLLALIIPAESFGERGIVLVYPLLSVGVLVAGAVMLTMSLVSHAPGATLWPLPSALVDWVHLLAAGAWVGGLLALVWVLRPALQPLDTNGKRLALLAVLKRFSPIGVVAVALMIASGIYASLVYLYTPAQAVTTSYGRTWLAKLILVAPLLLLGLWHNLALRPGRFQQAEQWLARTLRIESAVGISVLLAAALLTATPPPVPLNARAVAELPSYSAKVDDLTLTLTPNPGAVGANSYDVKLTRGEAPIDDAKITLQFTYPDLDKRSAVLPFDSIGDGLYSGAGGELNRAGSWLALFNVAPPGTDLSTRFALRLDVPEQARIGADRPASLLNILAMLGVFAVFAVWLLPPLGRRVRAAKIERQSLIVGIAAALFTILVLGGGVWYINNATNAFVDASNPKPVVINRVLPDQASVNAGRDLLDTCPIEALTTLNPVQFLQLRSDAEVYQAFEGSKNAACRSLESTQRWNYVNFLRFQFSLPPSP